MPNSLAGRSALVTILVGVLGFAPAPRPRPHVRRTPAAVATVVTPAVAPGGSLAVSWSGLTTPTAKDWLGIFVPGTASTSYLDWVYTNGQSAGSAVLPIAAARASGLYELRLLRNDGYTLAATGGLVQVGVPAPPPPPPPPPPPVVVGPRGAVGPDVPLTPAETLAFSRRVTVTGFTAAAITAACQQATQQGAPVVFMPAGTYTFERAVPVPGNLTLLGAGAGTRCRTPPGNAAAALFSAAGDTVRCTRCALQGFSTAWTGQTGAVYNSTVGLQAASRRQVRVDHCDLQGFGAALLFTRGTTAQVDHCAIHQNRVIGFGYGVGIDSGTSALVMDNEFGDCRHEFTANDSVAGYPPSHGEFVHNHLHNEAPSTDQRAAIDTHAQFAGSMVVEANLFDAEPDSAVGMASGSGLIQGNEIHNTYGAINLYPADYGGVPGKPHDIDIEGNTFVGVMQPLRWGPTGSNPNAVNIKLNGVIVASTYRASAPPPPALIRLQPFAEVPGGRRR